MSKVQVKIHFQLSQTAFKAFIKEGKRIDRWQTKVGKGLRKKDIERLWDSNMLKAIQKSTDLRVMVPR